MTTRTGRTGRANAHTTSTEKSVELLIVAPVRSYVRKHPLKAHLWSGSECDPRIKRIEPDRLPCFCHSVYDCRDKYHRRQRRRKRRSSSSRHPEMPQNAYIPIIPGPAMAVPALPVAGFVPAAPVADAPTPLVQMPGLSLLTTIGQSSTRLGSEHGPQLVQEMYTVPQVGGE